MSAGHEVWLDGLAAGGVGASTLAEYGKVLRWAERAMGVRLQQAGPEHWGRLPWPASAATAAMRGRVLRRYLEWCGAPVPPVLRWGTGQSGRPGPAPRVRQAGPGWAEALDGWQAWLATGAVVRSTLAERRYQLSRLAEDVYPRGPWALGADDLATWLAGHGWSRETLRGYRTALRSFYGWAHASGLIGTDPSRLLRKVVAAPGIPRPADDDAIAVALQRADARVYLMLMLAARHGLRRAEVAAVHTDDVLRGLDGWSLVVRGKGGRVRVVPLLDDVAAALRERPPGWAFPGRPAGRHLTARYVGKLLSGALPAGVTAHMLRHRFATTAYGRTRDIRAVQELLGHASVATTQVYTRVQGDALRAAVQAASKIG